MKFPEFFLSLDENYLFPQIKELFKNNDFSTKKSNFNPSSANEDATYLYSRAKRIFLNVWCENMKEMGGRGNVLNFSPNDPMAVLLNSQNEFISGTVIELISEKPDVAEELIFQFYDDVIEYHEDEFCSLLSEQLAQRGITEETLTEGDITEEDIKTAFDKIIDKILATMMTRFMKVLNVPELTELLKSQKNRSIEDFSQVPNNFDKNDFEKYWNQKRRKDNLVKDIVSLEEMPEDMSPYSDDSISEIVKSNETVIRLQHFIATLDETESKIMKFRIDGKSQDKIAEILGCTQSSVSKKLRKLKIKFDNFKM